jgi:hypothetical protein
MKTDIQFWSHLAQFFSEWEMFQTELVEKIKTHFMINIFFRKSCCLWHIVKKYYTVGQAKDDNIILCMRFACCILKATNTHSEYVLLIASPLQQWLQERSSMWRHTYSTLLVLCHRHRHFSKQHQPVSPLYAEWHLTDRYELQLYTRVRRT